MIPKDFRFLSLAQALLSKPVNTIFHGGKYEKSISQFMVSFML